MTVTGGVGGTVTEGRGVLRVTGLVGGGMGLGVNGVGMDCR